MAITIIKETGAVVAGANSYVTLAEADVYHATRNNTAWLNLGEDDRIGALIRACQQMEIRYRGGWYGKKASELSTQPLSWPRSGVLDEDGLEVADDSVPPAVLDAQCEIALMLGEGASFLTREITASDASIVSESVGPVSVSYSRGAGGQSRSTFPMVDLMLSHLCNTYPLRLNVSLGLTDAERTALAAGEAFDPANWPDYFNYS